MPPTDHCPALADRATTAPPLPDLRSPPVASHKTGKRAEISTDLEVRAANDLGPERVAQNAGAEYRRPPMVGGRGTHIARLARAGMANGDPDGQLMDGRGRRLDQGNTCPRLNSSTKVAAGDRWQPTGMARSDLRYPYRRESVLRPSKEVVMSETTKKPWIPAAPLMRRRLGGLGRRSDTPHPGECGPAGTSERHGGAGALDLNVQTPDGA